MPICDLNAGMFTASDGPALPPGIFLRVSCLWLATMPQGQPPIRV